MDQGSSEDPPDPVRKLFIDAYNELLESDYIVTHPVETLNGETDGLKFWMKIIEDVEKQKDDPEYLLINAYIEDTFTTTIDPQPEDEPTFYMDGKYYTPIPTSSYLQNVNSGLDVWYVCRDEPPNPNAIKILRRECIISSSEDDDEMMLNYALELSEKEEKERLAKKRKESEEENKQVMDSEILIENNYALDLSENDDEMMLNYALELSAKEEKERLAKKKKESEEENKQVMDSEILIENNDALELSENDDEMMLNYATIEPQPEDEPTFYMDGKYYTPIPTSSYLQNVNSGLVWFVCRDEPPNPNAIKILRRECIISSSDDDDEMMLNYALELSAKEEKERLAKKRKESEEENKQVMGSEILIENNYALELSENDDEMMLNNALEQSEKEEKERLATKRKESEEENKQVMDSEILIENNNALELSENDDEMMLNNALEQSEKEEKERLATKRKESEEENKQVMDSEILIENNYALELSENDDEMMLNHALELSEKEEKERLAKKRKESEEENKQVMDSEILKENIKVEKLEMEVFKKPNPPKPKNKKNSEIMEFYAFLIEIEDQLNVERIKVEQVKSIQEFKRDKNRADKLDKLILEWNEKMNDVMSHKRKFEASSTNDLCSYTERVNEGEIPKQTEQLSHGRESEANNSLDSASFTKAKNEVPKQTKRKSQKRKHEACYSKDSPFCSGDVSPQITKYVRIAPKPLQNPDVVTSPQIGSFQKSENTYQFYGHGNRHLERNPFSRPQLPFTPPPDHGQPRLFPQRPFTPMQRPPPANMSPQVLQQEFWRTQMAAMSRMAAGPLLQNLSHAQAASQMPPRLLHPRLPLTPTQQWAQAIFLKYGFPPPAHQTKKRDINQQSLPILYPTIQPPSQWTPQSKPLIVHNPNTEPEYDPQNFQVAHKVPRSQIVPEIPPNADKLHFVNYIPAHLSNSSTTLASRKRVLHDIKNETPWECFINVKKNSKKSKLVAQALFCSVIPLPDDDTEDGKEIIIPAATATPKKSALRRQNVKRNQRRRRRVQFSQDVIERDDKKNQLLRFIENEIGEEVTIELRLKPNEALSDDHERRRTK